MSSPEEQKALQKEALEGLVKAVQQRDVLFVLYHLQQLDARSLNNEDPFSQLTPLKIALSLPPDCPRRTLIVELLLLSGASLSQEQVDARLSDGHGASSGRTSASWASGSQAEADAKMLLHDLSLEDSEIWLRQQGLDVPEAYEEPPKQEKRQLHEQRSNTEHQTFEEARWVGARPPEPSPKRPRLSLPEERSFGSAPSPVERSPHRRHSQPPPLPHPSSTTNSFIVDCLAPETIPSTLKRFLATSLHSSSLIQSISPTFSSGAHAFLIILNSPIDTKQILDLDDNLLDGTRLRVQLDGSRTIAPFSTLSAPQPQYRRDTNTEDRSSSTSTSHPRRPTPRPASSPRRSLPPPARDRRPPSPSPWWEQEREELVWAPYKSCYYAYSFEDRASCSYLPPPPQGATQAELDRWAEATWVGRWAPDLPGLPLSWKPRPGAVWRG
ncbi:hypothetical protein BCR35DRAFT_156047 [Leucosporidium creatinivorum]|uniref:Uncharacterized protein n=1 Tax=Leucosporidium creatinivorum TaxID=106004 RepID=A0A1Y2FZP4_9BASI|nr:hypothetical protein BCR35DRAFT_156047 [Leucosporidium creatinivorum]